MADAFTNSGLTDGSGPPNISTSIDAFQQMNMTPSDIFTLGSSLPQTIGGIPGIGSRIPSLGKIPIPGTQQLNKLLAPLNSARFSEHGAFESIHYADDLNVHHPKFKFLFKVGFHGFPDQDCTASSFYFFVQRCDKPKVKFNHQDVNYYNFRTKVLTSVTYDPISIQFLDETGNSVNEFFKSYLELMSGTGSGNYGIDKGWGSASSSKPYANGYSNTRGQSIVLEQIFIDTRRSGGPRSNRFTFVNPRIESFDFDEVSHEDSNSGSMANITFNYDAINVETVNDSTIYSWGNTDLFAAGGSSATSNAGELNGQKMYSDGSPNIKIPATSAYDQLKKGIDVITNIPNALVGSINTAIAPLATQFNNGVDAATDIISKDIQNTLSSIQSGANSLLGGLSSNNSIPAQDPPSVNKSV